MMLRFDDAELEQASVPRTEMAFGGTSDEIENAVIDPVTVLVVSAATDWIEISRPRWKPILN